MAKFRSPESFNFTRPLEWPDWKQRFVRYRIATKMDKESGEVQVCSLIYAMGNEAEHIYKSFTYSETENRNGFDTVLKKFDEHFIPKRNVIYERAVFYQRVQNVGESVESFVRNLYELAETCDFGENKAQNIRDRIVIGILDKKVSRDLQMKSDLTLERAIETARHSELVKSQNAADAPPQTQSERTELDEVKKRRKFGGQRKQHNGGEQNYADKCGRCGHGQHLKSKCPAKDAQCHLCKKKGHFKLMCRTKPKSVQEVTENHNDAFFLGSVTCTDDSVSAWRVNLPLEGGTVRFKIDSGADVTVLTESSYNHLKPKPELKSTNTSLSSPGGPLSCMGQFTAHAVIKGETYNFRVFVVKRIDMENLLSRSTAVEMGLIKRVDHIAEDLFADIGLLAGEPVKITLKPDAEPYSVCTARRVPIPLLDKVQNELERMESNDIIEKVTKPTSWCAPMVPVVKKNGKIRICVDLKKLNNSVIREKYTMPIMDDVVHKLAGSTVFTKLDASSGFWQIPLDSESSTLTTFITPFGRYCFKRLPFGITSAPEIFQRKMTELLGDLPGTEVIMDDILVHGSNMESYDEHLNAVLDRIRKSGLKLNKDKCLFTH